jgi:hypothetical protein
MDREYVDNARRIILEAYVRIQSADPGARRQLKTSIYEELKINGQSEMAEVLLLYDAVMMGAMHEMTDKPNVASNFNNSQIANATFGAKSGRSPRLCRRWRQGAKRVKSLPPRSRRSPREWSTAMTSISNTKRRFFRR